MKQKNISLKAYVFVLGMLFLVTAIVSASPNINLSFSNMPSTIRHEQSPLNLNLIVSASNLSSDTIFVNLSQSRISSSNAILNIQEGVVVLNNSFVNIPVTISYVPFQTGAISGQIIASFDSSSTTLPFVLQIENTPSLSILKISDVSASQNGSIRVINNGNVPINNIYLSSSGNLPLEYNTVNFALNPNETRTFEIKANLSSVNFGSYSTSISAIGSIVNSSSVSFTIRKSFCPLFSETKGLKIRNVDITNLGDNDGDEDTWILRDRIKIEAEIKNTGNLDLYDIVAKLGLFDSDGNDVSDELEFISDDENLVEVGDLAKGDSEIVSFEFYVPSDFSNKEYKLALKAYSENNETYACVDEATDFSNSYFQSVVIRKKTSTGRYILFDKILIEPKEISCGDNGILTATIYNIGDENLNRVKITLSNSELKINETLELLSGLDMGQEKKISFNFFIPKDANNKVYNLALNTEYKYQSGYYRYSSDVIKTIPVTVSNCDILRTTTNLATTSFLIKTSLVSESEIYAGNEIVLRTTVKNLLNAEKRVSINLRDYLSWASIVSVEPSEITLQPNETKDILIKLKVDDSAEAGEKSFAVEVVSTDGIISRENVSLEVSQKKGFNISNLFGDNYLIWGIVAVNIILILLIIFVAVRLSKKE